MALDSSDLTPGFKVRVPAFAALVDSVIDGGSRVILRDRDGLTVTIPVTRLARPVPYVNGNLYADRYGTVYEYSGYNDGGIRPGEWFEYDLIADDRKADSGDYDAGEYAAQDYDNPTRPMREVRLVGEVEEDDD